MSAQREMTLEEWVNSLHGDHLAKRELAQLRTNVQHWMEACFKENKAKIEARSQLTLAREALEQYADGKAFIYNRVLRGELQFDHSESTKVARAALEKLKEKSAEYDDLRAENDRLREWQSGAARKVREYEDQCASLGNALQREVEEGNAMRTLLREAREQVVHTPEGVELGHRIDEVLK